MSGPNEKAANILSDELSIEIELLLTKALGKRIEIHSVIPLGGGCINECYELQTDAANFFLKKNAAKKYPKMFECEKRGLELLNETVQEIAPRVIAIDKADNELILLLEFIEKGTSQKEFWNDFAKKLSNIHRRSNNSFGSDHDNYIGSLPQSNKKHDDWISFFVIERIEPQLKRAIDEQSLPKEIHAAFGKLFARLEEIFPPEKPSLVHGDLWSGNYMIGIDGWVHLIDPAVYFGFREMDLAMARLFGGFDSSFFNHYNEFFPLENGFEKRVDICNLYPLLVHTNLFGGHYAAEVQSIVRRFH